MLCGCVDIGENGCEKTMGSERNEVNGEKSAQFLIQIFHK